MNRTIASLAALLLILAGSSSNAAAASPSAPMSKQILLRSAHSMQVVARSGSVHSESKLRYFRAAFGGLPSQHIVAHNSVECSGMRNGSHYSSAISATITGTIRAGKRRGKTINTRYIIFSSDSTKGTGTRTIFWRRDATKAYHWRRANQIVQDPAFSALNLASACPTGGYAFRLADGPGSRLFPPVIESTPQGQRWVIGGTTDSGAEHYSFRIVIDRATLRLAGLTSTYIERVTGNLVARQHTTTSYSAYGPQLTIRSPVAGSSTP